MPVQINRCVGRSYSRWDKFLSVQEEQVADGICFLVNGRMSAKALCHWMSIVARNVVDWNSMTTTLVCLEANVTPVLG